MQAPVPLRPNRRLVLQAAITAAAGAASARSQALPASLRFPRDAGAHTDFRTEWWYVTGALDTAAGAIFGFQLTFFRSRIDATQSLQSQLAARQLLFAHAAVTDVQGKRLWQAQRMARWSGMEIGTVSTDSASASLKDTQLQLQDWSLTRSSDGQELQAHLGSADFVIDLQFVNTQPLLLQGEGGLSRKGPDARQSSFYYSVPQLAVRGTLELHGRSVQAQGSSRAWLDHEWSQALLATGASGWDWIGVNLQDGGALTAFRLRDDDGNSTWAGGSYRRDGVLRNFSHKEVHFHALRTWRSPTSHAEYAVEWQVHTPVGTYTLRALLDNQEIDSTETTGAIYWEGLCEVQNSSRVTVGRGYLEMTGYADALQL